MDWPVAGECPRRRAFSLAILVSPQFLHATREHVCYSAIVVRNVCDGAVLPVAVPPFFVCMGGGRGMSRYQGGGNPRRANGWRRDRLRARVLGSGYPCWICGLPIDPQQPHMSPTQGVVDELVPVAAGGSPLDISNCAPAHRCCNAWRNTKPVPLVKQVQARVLSVGGASSPQQWCAIARRVLVDMRYGVGSIEQPRASTDW